MTHSGVAVQIDRLLSSATQPGVTYMSTRGPSLGAPARRVLEAVIAEIAETGTGPSIQALADRLGYRSKAPVWRLVDVLIARGLLERQGRNLIVRGAGSQPSRPVPLLGTVHAGEAFLALEEIEGFVPGPSGVHLPVDGFALRIRGDCMTGAGIAEGDIVFVAPQPDPPTGSIVVARRAAEDDAGEVLVRRLQVRDKTLVLHPESPAYEDVPIREGDAWQLVGRVVGWTHVER